MHGNLVPCPNDLRISACYFFPPSPVWCLTISLGLIYSRTEVKDFPSANTSFEVSNHEVNVALPTVVVRNDDGLLVERCLLAHESEKLVISLKEVVFCSRESWEPVWTKPKSHFLHARAPWPSASSVVVQPRSSELWDNCCDVLRWFRRYGRAWVGKGFEHFGKNIVIFLPEIFQNFQWLYCIRQSWNGSWTVEKLFSFYPHIIKGYLRISMGRWPWR